jgi:hypothetical protein
MRAAARRHDADTECVGDRHCLLHRAHADDETEAVFAVERCRDGRDAPRVQLRARVDQTASHPRQILWQELQAMRVDPPQIGVDQALGDNRCVSLGQAMRQK